MIFGIVYCLICIELSAKNDRLGLDSLVVAHVPDDKGHFQKPGQFTATTAARHNLIALSVLFRAGKARHHHAVCLNGCHRLLHFGIVPHLERMGPECMERMHLGKFQIHELAFLHRAGRGGWPGRSLLLGGLLFVKVAQISGLNFCNYFFASFPSIHAKKPPGFDGRTAFQRNVIDQILFLLLVGSEKPCICGFPNLYGP